MRGRHSALTITLTPHEQQTLAAMVRQTTIRAGLHRRAQVVLLRAQGQPITAIAQTCQLARQHVYKWLRRWEAEGLAGLQDRARPGRSAGVNNAHTPPRPLTSPRMPSGGKQIPEHLSKKVVSTANLARQKRHIEGAPYAPDR